MAERIGTKEQLLRTRRRRSIARGTLQEPRVEAQDEPQSIRPPTNIEAFAQGLKVKRRSVAAKAAKAASIEAKIAARQAEGKGTGGSEQRLARVQGSLRTEREELARMEAQIRASSPETQERIRLSTPRDFYSGRANTFTGPVEITPDTERPDETITLSAREANRQVREEQRLRFVGRGESKEVASFDEISGARDELERRGGSLTTPQEWEGGLGVQSAAVTQRLGLTGAGERIVRPVRSRRSRIDGLDVPTLTRTNILAVTGTPEQVRLERMSQEERRVVERLRDSGVAGRFGRLRSEEDFRRAASAQRVESIESRLRESVQTQEELRERTATRFERAKDIQRAVPGLGGDFSVNVAGFELSPQRSFRQATTILNPFVFMSVVGEQTGTGVRTITETGVLARELERETRGQTFNIPGGVGRAQDARGEVFGALREVPGAIAEGLNPRNPEGLGNIVALGAGVTIGVKVGQQGGSVRPGGRAPGTQGTIMQRGVRTTITETVTLEGLFNNVPFFRRTGTRTVKELPGGTVTSQTRVRAPFTGRETFVTVTQRPGESFVTRTITSGGRRRTARFPVSESGGRVRIRREDVIGQQERTPTFEQIQDNILRQEVTALRESTARLEGSEARGILTEIIKVREQSELLPDTFVVRTQVKDLLTDTPLLTAQETAFSQRGLRPGKSSSPPGFREILQEDIRGGVGEGVSAREMTFLGIERGDVVSVSRASQVDFVFRFSEPSSRWQRFLRDRKGELKGKQESVFELFPERTRQPVPSQVAPPRIPRTPPVSFPVVPRIAPRLNVAPFIGAGVGAASNIRQIQPSRIDMPVRFEPEQGGFFEFDVGVREMQKPDVIQETPETITIQSRTRTPQRPPSDGIGGVSGFPRIPGPSRPGVPPPIFGFSPRPASPFPLEEKKKGRSVTGRARFTLSLEGIEAVLRGERPKGAGIVSRTPSSGLTGFEIRLPKGLR